MLTRIVGDDLLWVLSANPYNLLGQPIEDPYLRSVDVVLDDVIVHRNFIFWMRLVLDAASAMMCDSPQQGINNYC